MDINSKDMILDISQGYKVPDSFFKDRLEESNGLPVVLDKKKIAQVVRSLGRKKLVANVDVSLVTDCIFALKELNTTDCWNLMFELRKNKSQKVESTRLQLERYGKEATHLQALDFIDRSSIPFEIVQFDFNRLFDWLAFEVGHESYDSDWTLQYFDEKLKGTDGVLYPAQQSILDSLIPTDIRGELMGVCVDTEANSTYYSKTTRKAYNYFMQDCTPVKKEIKGRSSCVKKAQEYIPFDTILSTQEDTLTIIVLYYLTTRALNCVLDLKLIEINNGVITFSIGENKYNKAWFKEHLTDTIYINILDRKFGFMPTVRFL